ncbi:Multidrug resistance protein MdtC [Leucobacter aridicollis]|uniref:efflux RND transporter permease subunit n=1 Tax=Leucobacter aridicollis TaxID=283878 RepID=UPI0037C9A581
MTPLTRLSLKNRLIVGLVTLGVAVLGIISMGALKQELMPSMKVPMAYVSVQADGLAPEELVTAVTEPVEQALKSVPGITSVNSDTSSGYAMIMVEWPFDEDADETVRTIRATLDALKPSFPGGAEAEVFSGGADDMPAMMLSAGTSGDAAEFGDALEQRVVPALQALPGVQKATLSGREDQRIVIDLRPGDVTKLKVEPAAVQAALQANGATLPAGQVDGDAGSIPIAVGTPLATVEEIAALPVATEDGVVRVSDFADVRTETIPAETISRVNGKPALTLQIMPSRGANVVQISHAVTAELDRQAPGLKAEFVTIFDQAPFIEQSIHDLAVEGGLGLGFAVLVILAFLASWRSTIIAAVSIPLSLLITLIGLQWSDNTLNILTLGALTIAIGRVVDDSIVVIENISRRRGTGPLTIEGVVASVRQVAGAITASTLTTVAVFLPIAFVSGMAGQLFRPFAITVSIALVASLVVALTIVPVLAYWFMQKPPKRGHGVADEHADPDHVPSELDEIHTAPDRLQKAFMPALSATRRHPVITLVSSGLILVLTLGMTAFLKTDFLGSTGQESLQLTQTAKEGATDLVAEAEPVERALAKVDGVRDVMTSIPVGAEGEPTISYDLQLADGADVAHVTDAVQGALDSLEDAGELRLQTQDAFVGDAGGGGIALQIRGTDHTALREASEMLEKELAEATGVQSVVSDIKGEQPVMRVTLDDAKATRLGFDRAAVAKAIQDAMSGETIGSLMLAGAERDIVLRTPGTDYTAATVGDLLLPVTPQQTAIAQKAASDALQEKADAEAEDQRLQANAELSNQIWEAGNQRAELVQQLGELNAQLAALTAAPVTPYPPLDPKEVGKQQAAQERAEQLAGLQGAIEGAQSGIAGIDEQIEALRQSQADAAQALVDQQAAEAEAKAATEVTGAPLKLSEIASVEEELTAPVITRADGERQVVLSVMPKTGQLDAANRAVEQAIATTDLPAGVSFELGGVSAEQDEAFGQLGVAMLAAIMLVLLVMVATFRSFRGPLVLLISIPFAATGAILGLLITGVPLGLPALIGLLMLIGIVVTNAIVLMDLINRLRDAGASLDEAVEHGTRLRLRPILMTAAATIFALVPMALGLTGGGVFISRPLAIVVIGGLVSSTLLTLILVPVLYTLVERRRERKLAKRAAKRAARAGAAGEAAQADAVAANGVAARAEATASGGAASDGAAQDAAAPGPEDDTRALTEVLGLDDGDGGAGSDGGRRP